MPIIFKNAPVGGQQPPTEKKVEELVNRGRTFAEIVREAAAKAQAEEAKIQAELQRKARLKPPVVQRVMTKQEPIQEPSRYIKETHGELVRHINTKSNYLKDAFDLDSNEL